MNSIAHEFYGSVAIWYGKMRERDWIKEQVKESALGAERAEEA